MQILQEDLDQEDESEVPVRRSGQHARRPNRRASAISEPASDAQRPTTAAILAVPVDGSTTAHTMSLESRVSASEQEFLQPPYKNQLDSPNLHSYPESDVPGLFQLPIAGWSANASNLGPPVYSPYLPGHAPYPSC